MKSQSREIGSLNDLMTLKFDWCRGACQISERSDNSKYKSRGFESSQDLMIRSLIGHWNGVLGCWCKVMQGVAHDGPSKFRKIFQLSTGSLITNFIKECYAQNVNFTTGSLNGLSPNKAPSLYLNQRSTSTGVYTKFSSRLSEEPFPWLIQKFPCILISKTGQPGCHLNLSEGLIGLDLTRGRPLV